MPGKENKAPRASLGVFDLPDEEEEDGAGGGSSSGRSMKKMKAAQVKPGSGAAASPGDKGGRGEEDAVDKTRLLKVGSLDTPPSLIHAGVVLRNQSLTLFFCLHHQIFPSRHTWEDQGLYH